MIRNYLRLAIRHFRRNKVYSVINVLGLSIGISCALIIVAYVHFELSFDQQHENYSRAFRLTESIKSEDGTWVESAKTPAGLLNAISDHGITTVDAIGRLFPFSVYVSADKETWNKEDYWVFADSTIADIFSIPEVTGSLEETLKNPMMVAISEDMVTKYFGGTDPIGKQLFYEDNSGIHSYSVGAVIANSPANSHFNYDILASFVSLETVMPWYNSWYHPYLYTYAMTSTGLVPDSQSDSHGALTKACLEALPQWEKENRTYQVQPLADIHLTSNLTAEWKANSRYDYILIFSFIAVFILVIACVNFINLATSKAIRRAREVGVRKVMGASRKMLIIQFLGESTLMTLLSFILAFALTEWVLLLVFNEIVDRSLSLGFLLTGLYPLYVILGLLLTGLFSGLYPAFALSSYNPASALRNKASGGRESARLRRILVSFQFGISCFLIAGTLIVVKQVNFMKSSNLGFASDYILLVRLNTDRDQKNFQQLIDQVSQYPGVRGATVSSHAPGMESLYDNPVMPENSQKKEGYNMFTLNVGPNFGNVYDLEILHGRDFSKENPSDEQNAIILNESAARLFGWDPGNSVGKKIALTWYTNQALVKDASVVGIVKDFHFKSLHRNIDPLVMHVNTHEYYTTYVSVRFTETGYEDALSFLTQEWKKFSPDRPIEVSFLDQELESLYQSETQASEIMSSFAVLAIFISCLGLFGLSAYAVERRTKEIGIRKTMGASVNTIVGLLAKDFMLLILIGNLIALPVIAILSGNWLDNFAYRTTVDFWIYFVTIVAAVAVGFLTISFQSIRAAVANPVESLKEE